MTDKRDTKDKKEKSLKKYRITIEIDPYELGKARIVRGIQRQMGPNWKDCSIDSCDCVPAYMAWLSVARALNQDPGPDLIGQLTNMLVVAIVDELKITTETKEQVMEKLNNEPDKLNTAFDHLMEAAEQTKKATGSKLPLAIFKHMKIVLVPDILADMIVETMTKLQEYADAHKDEIAVALAARKDQAAEQEKKHECTCETCTCDGSCGNENGPCGGC